MEEPGDKHQRQSEQSNKQELEVQVQVNLIPNLMTVMHLRAAAAPAVTPDTDAMIAMSARVESCLRDLKARRARTA